MTELVADRTPETDEISHGLVIILFPVLKTGPSLRPQSTETRVKSPKRAISL